MAKNILETSRAHQRYRTSQGEIVPGVTTVCGLLNKPFLVRWANQQGLKGIDSTEYTRQAARIGTLTHEIIQHSLGSNNPPDANDYTPNELELAEEAAEKFYKWRKDHDLETISMEEQLASDELKYGGAYDWYGVLDGKLTLMDLKTGKRIYDEYSIQLSAYRNLLTERDLKVERCIIVNPSREKGSVAEARSFDEPILDKSFEIFKHLLSIYHLKKELKW